MGSLIASDNIFAVAAVLFGVVFCGLLAERTDLGRKFSAPLIALAGGMVLSNIRVLPFDSPAYGVVATYLVPVAIPLLLLNADIKRIFRETGPTLIAFLAGAAGTTLGAVAGFLTIDLGPETHKVVGVLVATFIGGSVNFVAVSQALAIEDATLVASAATAQGVVAIVYLGMLIMAPGVPLLTRAYRRHRNSPECPDPGSIDDPVVSNDVASPPPVNVSACIAFSLLVCAVSLGIANGLGMPRFGILFITVVTVALASLAPNLMNRLAGGESIGILLVYVFICSVGAQSNVWQFFGATTVLVGFLGVLLTVHALCVLVAGRLFRLTLPEMVTGSNACAMGATTAAAIAAGKRWHTLVTPGILSGILGYIIANFIGVGLATALGNW